MPTKLKVLHGNPGKRPLNDREPMPSSGFPRCPEHLQGEARDAWENFGRELEKSGIGTVLDATALELLCASYSIYLDALQKTLQYGAVWVEKGDGKIPKFAYSPHWAVMNREWKNVKDMLQQFGMTPSSRSGIVADKKNESDELSELIA